MAVTLTIDLEDYFQVYNFSNIINPNEWDNIEPRIENNTQKILNYLDKHNAKATFFVLGWNAERFPQLIKKIHQKGHEIASHGYSHRPITEMTKEEFEEDLKRSIEAIQNATGIKPKGYRASTFSLNNNNLWALDILKKHGIKYDSSMIKIKHPDYGMNNIPDKPFSIKDIKEFPVSTSSLPVGGGYFRLYPFTLTKYLLKRSSHPIIYLHPWEFDPHQPRYPLKGLRKWRHYQGLKSTEKKFNKLLRDFPTEKVKNILGL